MSQEIDRNVVEMRFDNTQFEQGVKTSMKTIDKLKQSLNFESAVKGIDQINSSVKKVDMSPMSQAVEQVQYKFNALDIVAATVINRLTNSLIDAGKQLSKSTIGQIMTGGWSRATNIDKAKFSMKGLGYEWKQYSTALDYAVSNTAFGLDSAAKAAASLVASNVSLTKSMGFVDEAFEDGERDVTEMAMALRAISGVAAQTNSDYDSIAHIFTTIAGNGRLMTEQLNQFSYRGMNAAATLSDAMGVSETAIREMVRKGQIDFATFAKIMYDAFGEHAVAANETFEGALANMKAALSRIGADFAEHIRKYFIDPFNALRKMFNQVRQITKPFSKAFEVVMKVASSGATKLIESFTESLKSFAMDTDNWRESIPGISDLGMALYNTFHALYRIIKPIKDAFKTIFPRPTVEQIRAMAESIREFTERLLISDNTMNNLRSTFKGIFAIVKITINIIKVLFKVLEPVFIVLSKGLDILLAITGVIGEILSGISGAKFSLAGLYDILNGIGAILAFVGDGIVYVITHISEFVNNLAESVNITEAWNNALTFFQNILGKVSGAIEGISEFIKNIFKQLKPLDEVLDGIKTTFNNFVNTVKQKGLKVLENLEKVFKNLSEYIKGVKEDFLSLIDAMKSGDINTTLSRFNEIFDKRFTNLLGGIGNTLSKIPGMFKSVFSSGNLLGNVKTDIQTMNEEVVELEKNLTGSTMDRNAKFAIYAPKDLNATSNALSVLRQQLSDVDESTEEVSGTVRKARFTDEAKNITKAVNTMRETALKPTFGGKKSNNWLVDKIIKIKDAIVDFVKSINWAQIAGVAFLGLLFYIGVTITKVINSTSNLILSTSKLVETFTEKLAELSFTNIKKRNPFTDLAVVIGVIAASLVAVSFAVRKLNTEQISAVKEFLTQAMNIILVTEAMVIGIIGLTRNLKKDNNLILNASLSIVAIGAAVALFAESISIVSEVDPNKLANTVLPLVSIVTALTGIITLLGLINNQLLAYEIAVENGHFIKRERTDKVQNHLLAPVLTLVALCGAMRVLSKAINNMADVPTEKLDGITVAISTLMITLSLMAIAAKGMGFFSTSSIILALIAISVILRQVKKITDQVNINNTVLDRFASFLGELAKVLIAVVGVAAISSVVGDRMEAFALSMLGISVAVGVLVYALAQFNQYTETYTKAAKHISLLMIFVITMSNFFSILVTALSILYKTLDINQNDITKIAASIVSLVGVMSLLLLMSYVIGGFSSETIEKLRLGGQIVAQLGILASIMSAVGSMGGDKIPNLLPMTMILLELFAAVTAFSTDIIDIEKVRASVRALTPLLYSLAGLFAGMALLGASLNHVRIKDTDMMEQQAEIFRHFANSLSYILLTIGEILIAVGALAVAEKYGVNVDKVEDYIEAISRLILALGGMFATMSLIKPNDNWKEFNATLIPIIFMMTEVLGTLIALTVIPNVNTDAVYDVVWAMTIALGALSGFIISLNVYTSKDVYNAIYKVELLRQAIIGMGVMFGALLLISDYQGTNGNIAMALVAMTATLFIFKGLLSTLTNDRIIHLASEKMIPKMVLLMAGLAELAIAMGVLSQFSWYNLLSAAGGISLCMVAYAQSLKAIASVAIDETFIKKKKEVFAAMAGSVILIASIAYSLAELSRTAGTGWGSIGIAVGGIASAIAAYCKGLLSIKLTVKDLDAKTALKMLAALAGGVALFATFGLSLSAISNVKNVDWKNIAASAVGMSLCLGAFTLALKILNKNAEIFGDTNKALSNLVGLAGIAIASISLAFALRWLTTDGKQWSDYQDGILAMSGTLAAFGVLLYAMEKVQISSDTIKNFAAFMAVLTPAFIALSGALYILSISADDGIFRKVSALALSIGALAVLMTAFKLLKVDFNDVFTMAGSMVVFAGYMATMAIGFNHLAEVPWTKLNTTAVVAIIGITAAFSALIAATKGTNGLAIATLAVLAVTLVTLAVAAYNVGNAFIKMGEGFKSTAEAFSVLDKMDYGDIAMGIINISKAILSLTNLQLSGIIFELRYLNEELFKFKFLAQSMDESGKFAVDGLYNGITENINKVTLSMETLGKTALNAFYKTVGQNSPWKTLIQSGQFGVLGLAIGILANMHYGTDAMQTMGDAMVETGQETVVEMEDLYAGVPEKTAQVLVKNQKDQQDTLNDSQIESMTEAANAGQTAIMETTIEGAEVNAELASDEGAIMASGLQSELVPGMADATTAGAETIGETLKELAGPLMIFMQEVGSALGEGFIHGLIPTVMAGCSQLGKVVMTSIDKVMIWTSEKLGNEEWAETWRNELEYYTKAYDESTQYFLSEGLKGLGDTGDKLFDAFDKLMANSNIASIIEKYSPKDNFTDWFNLDDLYEDVQDNTDAMADAMNNDLVDSFSSASEASKDLASSLYETIDAFGEFDKSTELTASKLLSNMKSQLDGMRKWSTNLASLKGTISDALYEKLLEEGTSSYKTVNALKSMSTAEREYASILYEGQLTESLKAANRLTTGIISESAKANSEMAENAAKTTKATYNNANTLSSKYSKAEIERAKQVVKAYNQTFTGNTAIDSEKWKAEEAAATSSIESINNQIDALKNKQNDVAKQSYKVNNIESTEKAIDQSLEYRDIVEAVSLQEHTYGKELEHTLSVEKTRTDQMGGYYTALNELNKARDSKERQYQNSVNRRINLSEEYIAASKILEDVEKEKAANNAKNVKTSQKQTDVISEQTQALKNQVKVLGPNGEQWVELSEIQNKSIQSTKTLSQSFSELVNELRKYGEENDYTKDEVEELARQFIKANPDILKIGLSFEEITMAMMDMEIEMKQVKETISQQVKDSIKIFEKWDDEFELSSEDMLDNMHSQIRGLTKWSGQLSQLAERGIDAGLLSYLQSLGPQGAEYVNAFAQMTADELAEAGDTYAHAMNLGDEIGDQLVDSYAETGYFLTEGFADGIINGTGMAEQSAMNMGQSALNKLREVLQIHSPSDVTFKDGEFFTIGFADGTISPAALAYMKANISTLTNTTITSIKIDQIRNRIQEVGRNIAKGLANGINDGATSAVTAAKNMMTRVIQISKKTVDSHSPSRIFENDLGLNIPLGLAQGLEKYAYLAYNAAESMAQDTIEGFNSGYSGISKIIDWDDLNPVVTPTLNLDEVSEGVKSLNSMIDRQQEIKAGFDEYGNQNESEMGRVVFNQYNNSPKALDRIEIYRQTKNLISTSRG